MNLAVDSGARVSAEPRRRFEDSLELSSAMRGYRTDRFDRRGHHFRYAPETPAGMVLYAEIQHPESGATVRDILSGSIMDRLGISIGFRPEEDIAAMRGLALHPEQIKGLIVRAQNRRGKEAAGLHTIHTNGVGNIFLMCDEEGEVFVVNAYRDSGMWDIDDLSLDAPFKRPLPERFFFRISES